MSTATVPMPPPADPLDVETPKGYELIDGRLVEKAMSQESAWVGSQVFGRLWEHCRATDAGHALGSEAAYRCFPDRPRHSRKPDASFISRQRLPTIRPGPGDFAIPPDLAVEVLSPNEEAEETNAKLLDFRSVGVPLIWIIDPTNRAAHVYTPESIRLIREDEELSGGAVLPGFRVRLGDVLLPAAPLADQS
jgi:Uma2 family endonuclease